MDWSVVKRTGSSPHVRGALNGLGWTYGHGGIIPACAGSTPDGRRSACDGRDHPRMCGEHIVSLYMKFICVGSSPHVRGARLV